MSRKGGGSVDRTADGGWRVRVTLPDGRRVSTGIFATQEEALRARVSASKVLANEVPGGSVSVRDHGNAVLTDREVNRKVADPDSDWSRWNTHVIGSPLARLAVKSVQLDDVQQWFDRVHGRVAHSTALNCLNVLRVVFRQAVRQKIIKVNPTTEVEIPRRKVTVDPWDYSPPEEQAALLAAAKVPERYIVQFAMGSGMRAGEVVTLRLADVHLGGHEPHVMVRFGGPPAKPTKGGKPRRVPLFGHALEGLTAWAAQLATYAPVNAHGLAFPGRQGGFRSPEHVLRWAVWKGILERAGIAADREHYCWHSLRHTCGSSLVSGWWGRRWSTEEVKALLGHADIATTQRYAHLGDTALKAAARETTNRPSIGLQTGASMHSFAANTWAPPGRVELPTNGLGSPCEAPIVTRSYPTEGRFEAIRFLESVVSGTPDMLAAKAMAAAVMARAEVALAVQVARQRGTSVRAAIELAEALAGVAVAHKAVAK